MFADRGYDHDKYRRLLRQQRITPKIARRGDAHGSGLGKHRWLVERTFSWLHNLRRLRTRYERRADIHQAMISIACSVICLRRLLNSFRTDLLAGIVVPLDGLPRPCIVRVALPSNGHIARN
ncbi:transposase [Actinoplanes friuliensis DSM 7358]|uniref:Transposase n=1 Tax=Actinoplanes friuliensis DSM 7358 TaxID=1246995 RepID=U5VYD7_9ACTN|nr:transposase [Actinoplanes friuliensis DSM 7358]